MLDFPLFSPPESLPSSFLHLFFFSLPSPPPPQNPPVLPFPVFASWNPNHLQEIYPLFVPEPSPSFIKDLPRSPNVPPEEYPEVVFVLK